MSKKWAIYARCSTDEQAKEGYSIEIQISSCIKILNEMKDVELFKIYTDEGLSGSDSIYKRPAIMELLSDIKNRKFDGLCIYKADRLSRISEDREFLIRNLIKYKINIVSYSGENLIDNSPQGEFIRRVLANIDELEVKTLAFRIKSAMRLKAEKGEWKGGTPPYGYIWNKDNKKMIPDNKKLQQVKLIYDLYINKLKGINTIRDYLNKSNNYYINGEDKSKWNKDRVRGILLTPIYCGYQYHNKKYSKFEIRENKKFKNKNDWELFKINYLEPIISKQTWDESCYIRENRRKKIIPRYKTSWLLTGLIYCKNCDRPLQGHPIINKYKTKKGEIKSYDCSNYICIGRVSEGREYCNAKQIVKKDIEKIVLEDVIKHVESLKKKIGKYSDEQISNILSKYKENEINDINTIKNELNNIDKKINRYYIDYEDNKITAEILTPAINRLKLEKETLKNKCDNIMKNKNQENDVKKCLNNYKTELSLWLKEFLKIPNEDIKEKKIMLNSILKKISVMNDGKNISIEYEYMEYFIGNEEGFPTGSPTITHMNYNNHILLDIFNEIFNNNFSEKNTKVNDILYNIIKNS